MTEYHIEHDTMGEVQVPADQFWGAQTERSRNNFRIGEYAEGNHRNICRFKEAIALPMQIWAL